LISSAESEGLHLFAVADGHGIQGHLVSQLTVKRLDEYFHQNWGKEKSQEGLFTDIYSRIQGELFETKEFNANTSGTTLVSLLL
jgi:serine/threonine protein phosphatase PrpC